MDSSLPDFEALSKRLYSLQELLPESTSPVGKKRCKAQMGEPDAKHLLLSASTSASLKYNFSPGEAYYHLLCAEYVIKHPDLYFEKQQVDAAPFLVELAEIKSQLLAPLADKERQMVEHLGGILLCLREKMDDVHSLTGSDGELPSYLEMALICLFDPAYVQKLPEDATRSSHWKMLRGQVPYLRPPAKGADIELASHFLNYYCCKEGVLRTQLQNIAQQGDGGVTLSIEHQFDPERVESQGEAAIKALDMNIARTDYCVSRFDLRTMIANVENVLNATATKIGKKSIPDTLLAQMNAYENTRASRQL